VLLTALLMTAIGSLVAGCSHVATVPADEEESNEVAADLPPETTSVDEADIGTFGPAQIEEAIETLDAQTEEEPPLVRALSNAAQPTLPTPSDLFERMRDGFALSDVDHAAVEREVTWFTRHPAYLDRTFKRGERYLYHIVSEIEARGLPLELSLLPIVESAFNPVAYSRARASGLWQFIPGTGRRYGLKQNWYYDGRRDVVAATCSALDYLEFLAAEFDGDWLLAVAAYNTGEMNVARAVERNRAAGKPTDFFSLKLPRETRAYVPKLLAMRRIVADPTSHGLAFSPIPNQPYFAKVDVGGQVDLHLVAELTELPKEEILALNPAFNHWVTDPDGPHQLLVPVDYETRLSEAIASLPPEKRVRVVYHRVRTGDTLGGIADKYGVSIEALRATNKLRGTLIHPGQDLLIAAAPRGASQQVAVRRPAAAEEPSSDGSANQHVVRRGDTLWSIAKAHGVSVDKLTSANDLQRSSTLTVGQVLAIPGPGAASKLAAASADTVTSTPTTYIVRAGDTLMRIANKFRVTLADLVGWNDLDTSSIIKPGQRLVMYVDGRHAGI
jgi:membrane-bound lytic murein transglycosylase D